MNDNENENKLQDFQVPARDVEQAPSSLLPALLTRIGLSGSKEVPTPPLATLRTAMADPEWTVRVEVVQKLERLSDRASLQLLLIALRDEDSSVRATAVRVLGLRIHTEEGVVFEHLETALHDPEWHVRETAVYALGMLSGQSALFALKLALHDPDTAVRRAAQLVSQRLQQEALHVEQVQNPQSAEPAPQSAQIFVGTWSQRMRYFALRLFSHLYTYRDEELVMLKETDHGTIEYPPIVSEKETKTKKVALPRLLHPDRPLVRKLERGLAVVLVLAIVVGWLALSHLPRSSSSSPGVFSDINAHSLSSPVSTFQGNLSYVEGWPAAGHTFYSLQVDAQKHALKMRMLDATGGRVTTYSVLDASWIAALNQYNISQVGHYLVALRPQGKNLATMEIWDITGQHAVTIQTIPAQIGSNGVVLAPWLIPSENEQKLAMLLPDGTGTIWDVASGQKQQTFKSTITYKEPSSMPIIKWYDHDQSLLLLDRGGQLEAWDVVTGARLFSVKDTAGTYFATDIAPNGKYLLLSTGVKQQANSATPVDAVEILDARSGQVLRNYHLNVPSDTGVTLIWLPDNRRILTISNYNPPSSSVLQAPQVHTRIWDAFTGQETFHTSTQAGNVWTTPNRQYLIIGNADSRTMKIWQTSNGNQVATVTTPGIYPTTSSFYSINDQYMVIGEKSSFDIWDIATGKLLYKYHGATPFTVDGNGGSNLFWSPDGKYLTMIAWKTASIGDGTLSTWRLP